MWSSAVLMNVWMFLKTQYFKLYFMNVFFRTLSVECNSKTLCFLHMDLTQLRVHAHLCHRVSVSWNAFFSLFYRVSSAISPKISCNKVGTILHHDEWISSSLLCYFSTISQICYWKSRNNSVHENIKWCIGLAPFHTQTSKWHAEYMWIIVKKLINKSKKKLKK